MNDDLGMFDILEYTQLRTKAIDLLDRCLTEGDEQPMIAFVDEQIAREPPRLDLLRELADDLQLRLLSLKEHRFDLRDRIVRLFQDYGIDITEVAPPQALDRYYQLKPGVLIACAAQQGRALEAQDVVLLTKAVEASLERAAQLTHDIQLTTRLHRYVVDWVRGLNVQAARRRPDERFTSGRPH